MGFYSREEQGLWIEDLDISFKRLAEEKMKKEQVSVGTGTSPSKPWACSSFCTRPSFQLAHSAFRPCRPHPRLQTTPCPPCSSTIISTIISTPRQLKSILYHMCQLTSQEQAQQSVEGKVGQSIDLTERHIGRMEMLLEDVIMHAEHSVKQDANESAASRAKSEVRAIEAGLSILVDKTHMIASFVIPHMSMI